MLFNSFEFALLFPAVFILYWSLKDRVRLQNYLLLLASYIFYGYWDWRFLSLIWLSTITDYIVGHLIRQAQVRNDVRRAKRWLLVSVGVNLGILGFFKYAGFFVDSFIELFSAAGISLEVSTLNIILPVGISFYTFQTMSYSIDVYRKKIEPCRDPLGFAVYVAFFPQLVAGPIERAKTLLPQILSRRSLTFDSVYTGLSLCVLGFFKKVYVADNLAPHVDRLFSLSDPTGTEVAFAAWLFAFQIYADFSGYSDIARGTARLLGIELRLNFRLPYFSANPQEFWHRWHISLSTWLRDYLYIPLGGNKGGSAKTYRNLMITMLLGGLWHGAAWTFVVWGAYQGALLAAHRAIIGRHPTGERVKRFHLAKSVRILLFFQLVCVGWLIFRAPSIASLGVMIEGLFSTWSWPEQVYLDALVAFVMPLLLYEGGSVLLRSSGLSQKTVGQVAYASMLGVIAYLTASMPAESIGFIYFQF
jgi:D-alanyl-lipoteichoic acid acyltransferase DltB (MBOAT superfamily)